MSLRSPAGAWLAGTGYVVAAALPLAVAALLSHRAPGWSWPVAFSVGTGFVAFGVLALQVALVARLGWVSRAIGSDALMHLHRGLGVVALVFLCLHPVLLANDLAWSAWNPLTAAGPLRPGALAFWAVAAIGLTSWKRRTLRLGYEAWHALHLALSLVAVGGAAAHIVAMNGAASSGLPRGLVLAYAGAAFAIIAWYRLARPWRLSRQPWRVAANDEVGGSTRLLRVVPIGHPGLAFEAGQFAWVSTGRSPLWSQQHPLSIASSDARPGTDGLEFAVKALGDWSGTEVPRLRAGDRVWVDGPFGAFVPARAPAGGGLLLIAGGIGIAPVRAILASLADRADRRPVVLVHAAHSPSRAVFAEEMSALGDRLSLTVVPVYEQPPAGWTGERGYVTRELLARHLPENRREWACFACGPEPMMRAVERAALALGLPAAAVHTERFTMV